MTLTAKHDSVGDMVLRELEWDPEVDASEIGVTAADGTVTLTGFVDTYAAKLAAERAAKRVFSVRAVANDIAVKARIERADPDIAKDVVQALQNRISVPGTVQATVRNGHVILDGVAEWMYQRVAAESAVKYLQGVKGVANYIEIKSRVAATDVKAKIEDALRRNAEVDARRISVESQAGTVSLFGSVRSWREKTEVERVAWAAPGVWAINSYLVVVP